QRPLTCIRHGSFRQSLSTLPARRRPRTSSQFRDDVVFFGRNLLEVADELFTLIRRKTLDEVAVLFRLRRRRQTFQFCAPFVTDHVASPSATWSVPEPSTRRFPSGGRRCHRNP